jgi:Zn-dependent peptidase ImmA (M78 family)
VTVSFERGFKASCERLSHEIRLELDLSDVEPFDPRVLARHLAIPVCSLPDLRSSGAPAAAVGHFLSAGRADFSAMTVFRGSRRLIVENPSHATGRRANSLSHELAHVLLEHDAAPALDPSGCRYWSSTQEQEADWLGGVLLIPRPAALHIVRQDLAIEAACEHYGVSAPLLRWRLGQSGAKTQIERARRFKRARS